MAVIEETAIAVEVIDAPEKKPAESKAKKPAAARKKSSPPSHPPFIEMIIDAIVTLKEKTGSSQYAITKFIEEKHKDLLPSFRKLLLVNLKKLVASNKLVKIKNSYKLTSASKPIPAKKPAKSPAKKPVKAPAKTKSVAKPTAKAAAKPKPKAKTTAAKPKSAVKPKAKVAKTAKTKKAPTKSKSVKSPTRKTPARKAKR